MEKLKMSAVKHKSAAAPVNIQNSATGTSGTKGAGISVYAPDGGSYNIGSETYTGKGTLHLIPAAGGTGSSALGAYTSGGGATNGNVAGAYNKNGASAKNGNIAGSVGSISNIGRSNEDIYSSKYDEALSSALNKLMSNDKFTYEPEKDVVYRAYADMYKRNAEDAYRDILNKNNASIRGAGGAVLGEALASKNEYLKKLNDIIPTVAEDAYERYSDMRNRERQELSDIRLAANDTYERFYNAMRDKYNDMRDEQAYERQLKQDEAEAEQQRFENKNTLARLERDLQNADYENEILRAAAEYADKNEAADYSSKLWKNKAAAQDYDYNSRMNPIKLSDADLDLIRKRGFADTSDVKYNDWLGSRATGNGRGYNGSAYNYDPYLSDIYNEYFTSGAAAKAALDAMYGSFSMP